jgi:hypothetical protein
MVLLFRVLIAIFLAVAGYFFWDSNRDGVFVSLVLASCSFFLSMRFQIKMKMKMKEKEEEK